MLTCSLICIRNKLTLLFSGIEAELDLTKDDEPSKRESYPKACKWRTRYFEKASNSWQL